MQPSYPATSYPPYASMPYAGQGPSVAKFGSYSGVPVPDKDAPTIAPWLLSAARKRVNIVAVGLAILLPWLLFAGIYAILSFEFHHSHPEPTYFLIALGAVLWIFMFVRSIVASARQKYSNDPADKEPTWFLFLAISCLVAWAFGVILGDLNFSENMSPYYDLKNLNTYHELSVTSLGGKGLMDAGAVYFEEGTAIDRTKALGFKDEDIYCVAPITVGNASLATYDFWAVGMNCCNGFSLDFHCADIGNPKARAGLRLMSNSQSAYYRLAIQQAEAAYGIKAVHPLFFTWTEDPLEAINTYSNSGVHCFVVGAVVYMCFQLLCVAALLLFHTRSMDWWYYRHWDRHLGGPSASIWRAMSA